MQTEHEQHAINGLLNVVLWTCCNSTSMVLLVTNAIDLVQFVEVVKAMVTMSISIISCLFMYIINKDKIHTWFKTIQWRKKKKANDQP
jgi:hypothetical protein